MKPNAQIRDEASAWFVEFSEGDVSLEMRQEFSQWLRASPEHVRAYLAAAATFEDLGALDKSRTADAELLVRRALAEGNVVSLSAPPERPAARRSSSRATKWRPRVLATAATLTAVALAIGTWQLSHRGLYSTGIGEQRLLNLADGSTIELNAESRIRVHLGDRERTVDLLEGQALFHVAKDASRPFIVHSDSTSVRAVGTQFDVNRETSDTVVTVLEGRVAIATNEEGDASARGPTLYLSAGDQVTLAQTSTPNMANSHPKPTRADTAAVTAWTRHKLVFASSPLPQVVDEYNRYHEKPLRVADPALADFRISGVFSAADASTLIAFLRAQPNVQVEENDREIVLKSR